MGAVVAAVALKATSIVTAMTTATAKEIWRAAAVELESTRIAVMVMARLASEKAKAMRMMSLIWACSSS
jgi:hypothetical protein